MDLLTVSVTARESAGEPYTLVEIESDETGTTVRLHMNLPLRDAGQ